VKSIAVLPLVNASDDPKQQFFSDGLSESLIDALVKFEGIRVIGRMSSFQFRNSKEDAASIGKKLGAAYLLGGSVQHAGDMVRIRAEVVAAKSGAVVWTQQYDRQYRDLFALQDDVTQAIAHVLEVKLLPAHHTQQGDRPASGNVAAYSMFLQAKFQASLSTADGFRQAIALMRQAVVTDPGYAFAWASLGRYYSSRATLGMSENTDADYAAAVEAISNALRLDPDLAEAHMAKAWLLENSRLDLRGAMQEYEKALSLSPTSPWVRFNAYGMRALTGQLQGTLEQVHRALLDDPLSATSWSWYSTYLLAAGRTDAAEAAIRKSMQLQPNGVGWWTQITAINIVRGNAAAALKAAHNEPAGVWHDIAQTLALQIGRDRAAADTALQALIRQYGDTAPYQIAQAQALRRDPDAVFQWLEHAYVVRDGSIEMLLVDPMIMRYRNDPRMAALSLRLGLPVPETSQTRGI